MSNTPLKSRLVVYEDNFDATGFTDQNSLVRALADKPDTLNPVVTMLTGAWSNKFPLQTLTEGQIGGTDLKEIGNIQYDWAVMGSRKTTEIVTDHPYSGADKPGIGRSEFFVTFKSKWFTPQATLKSKNGIYARVMGEPTAVGSHYRYRLQLFNPDANAYVPLTELARGSKWAMVGGSTVSESLSMGNRSNVQTPGKRKNQMSVLRKSYRLAGNISKKIVEFQMFNTEGVASNLWIDFEEFQHMIAWKQELEEHLWTSEYNRDEFGQIHLTDPDTGQLIPTGAGVIQQIPNSDSYVFLTEKKIKTIVGDVFRGATDTGAMEVILYTGDGGCEEFDNAMKGSELFSKVSQGNISDKFVTGTGRNLMLGGFFTSYQHIDGHMVTIKKLDMLDHGGYADATPRHPISGRPLSSYEMYFIDQSTYQGKRNMQMVAQKGRMEIRGLEQGMSLVRNGGSFSDYNGNGKYVNLATEQDATSIHFLSTKGICMYRNTHCFKLLPAIS